MQAMRWFALVSLVSPSSCSALGHGCTAIGCADGASLTFRSADGTWPDGSYVLMVTKAGTAHACALELPRDLPERGFVAEVPCDPPLDFPGATLHQDSTCSERRTEDAIRQSCTPIPGQYTLDVGVSDTPAELRVSVTRDESVLLEQSVTLSYTESRPNGEGCEPVCRRASAELVLP